MNRKRDTVLAPAHPMQEVMDNLYSPGQIAAFECIRCITRSLIRARVLDAHFAEELQERAMAAIAAGGTAIEVLATWLPINDLVSVATSSSAWAAKQAPALPGLPQGGGDGLPATRAWPPLH